MQPLLFIVAIGSFVSSTAAQAVESPKPYDECDEPGDEFFYLVQQWPPGFCEEEECPRSPLSRYTLHGFWPNYCQSKSGKEWPQFCSGEKLDLDGLSDLLPALRSEWPSLTSTHNEGFWEHEWDKHGTCALAYTPFGLNSQHEYFEKTLELHRLTNLYDNLASQGILPGGEFTILDIENALVNTLGGTVSLNCDSRNVIVEILVCYNQELHLVPCSKRGTCPRDQPLLYLKTQGQGMDPRVVLGSVTLLCVFAVGMLAVLTRLM